VSMLQSNASKDYNEGLVDQQEDLVPSDVSSYTADESSPRSWKCKDMWAGLVFGAGVGLMTYGLVLHKEGLEKEWKSSTAALNDEFGALAATQTLGASFGVAALFSIIWLVFLRYCVKCAVYGLFAITLVAELAGCVALFYLANSNTVETGWETSWLNGFAICVLLLFLYTVWVLYTLANRVALGASMIKVAGGVLKQHPSLFVVDALLAAAKFGWVVFCGASAWAIIGNTEQDTFWVGTGLALMTYWGLQVIGNIALVASYGAFGDWYYNGKASILAPLCRAFTVHFGSICFGSLVVAAIETIHDLLHAASKKGYIPSWVMCCIDRALSGIQSTVEYVNKYGFVQVAVHDETFLSASHRAISFLKYKGLTALINDSIVYRLAQVGSLGGGLLSGVVPVLVMRCIHHEDLYTVGLNGDQETTLAFSGFFLGTGVVYTLISPFPAMVDALLVCFAEHPEVLAKDHAEEYKALIEPWEGVYGADFVDKAATRANMDIERSGLMTGGSKYHPLAHDLEKLVVMKEAGELTEQEFSAAKEKLLS